MIESDRSTKEYSRFLRNEIDIKKRNIVEKQYEILKKKNIREKRYAGDMDGAR